MMTLDPDSVFSSVPASRAVSRARTGLTSRGGGGYRPRARASFVPPAPRVGRHVAAVAAPGLVAAVAGSTVTAAALMMGLGR